jgi:hypothetical protein
VEAQVLNGDSPARGHFFVYDQRVNRSWQGVEIRVEVL